MFKSDITIVYLVNKERQWNDGKQMLFWHMQRISWLGNAGT
jgi:hypothetical protein